MKQLLGGLLVMIFATVIAQGQGNKVEQEVLKLEQQWQEALVKGDAAALEKLYHDALIYTHSNASTDNKATYIAKIKTGATKYLSIKRDDIKVSIFDDTAIVTCHWLVHAQAGGNQIHTDARFIHVYLRQKGGWQMVAHQSTSITK